MQSRHRLDPWLLGWQMPAFLNGFAVDSLNMWLGSSASPSTTSLHVDKMENLCAQTSRSAKATPLSPLAHEALLPPDVVAAGQKDFVLFDPSHTHEMGTVSPLSAVFPHGRPEMDMKQTLVFGGNLGMFSAFGTTHAGLPSAGFGLEGRPAARFRLAAGEALLLPCGWSHQVTTTGTPHLALNVWFQPQWGPDKHDPSKAAAYLDAALDHSGK